MNERDGWTLWMGGENIEDAYQGPVTLREHAAFLFKAALVCTFVVILIQLGLLMA